MYWTSLKVGTSEIIGRIHVELTSLDTTPRRSSSLYWKPRYHCFEEVHNHDVGWNGIVDMALELCIGIVKTRL